MARRSLREAALTYAGDELGPILSAVPPHHLFHYTNAAGAVGIATTKELWATHIQFLNDSRELVHAADSVRTDLNNFTRMFDCSGEEILLLAEMGRYAGSMNGGIFVAALTTHRDQLSQWRAYCPTGGYAIGFPTTHLVSVAREQGFYIAPCIYEERQQGRLTRELIFRSLGKYYAWIDGGVSAKDALGQTALHFADAVSQYGILIKNGSFSEESEWRIVSPRIHMGDQRVRHRAAPDSIVPYTFLRLLTPSYPRINDPQDLNASILAVAGPAPDMSATQIGLMSLMLSSFGMGFGNAVTNASYRHRGSG